MSCRGIRDKLSRHVDGRLDAEETRSVEEHVAACEGCRAELESLTALVDDLGRLDPVPVPGELMDDLRAAFRAELDQGTTANPGAPSLAARLGGYRIAAGIAALAFATAVFLSERTGGRPETAAQPDEVGGLDVLREDEDRSADDFYASAPPSSGREAEVETAEKKLADDDERASGLRRFTGDEKEAKAPAEPAGAAKELEYGWRHFERYYDELVGAERSLDGKSEGRRDRRPSGGGETADAAALGLLQAATDLSLRGGLVSPPGDPAFTVVQGFLATDRAARAGERLKKTSDLGAVEVPDHDEEESLERDADAPAAPPQRPSAASSGTRPTMPRSVRCYFVFGPDAGALVRKAAVPVADRVEVLPITSLGNDRARGGSVGEQIAVTLTEDAARKLVAGLEKDRAVGLRLFSERPRVERAEGPAAAAGAAGGEAKSKPAKGADKKTVERRRRRTAPRRDTPAADPGREQVTIHFIVPR